MVRTSAISEKQYEEIRKMKLEKLTEDELLKKMGTLEGRGVLNGYFFGEPYFKEGNLYIKRDIVTANVWAGLNSLYAGSYGHRILGPELLMIVEAEHLGLKPLTSREVCLDLIQALEKIGLRDKLVPEINRDNPKFNRKDLSELGAMASEKVGYFILGTGVLYERDLCNILLKADKTPIISVEHTLRSDTHDVGVIPKVQEIEGIGFSKFLAAYKRNIEVGCIKSYAEELKKREERRHIVRKK